MSDAESEAASEAHLLHELGDDNLQYVEHLSSPTRLVFRLINSLGDASLALGRVNVMFRGDADILNILNRVYLVLRESEEGDSCSAAEDAATCNPKTAVIAEADVDPEMEDVRVLVFPQWNHSVPLPLGSSLQNKLYIYIHTREPLDKQRVKFGADMIATPTEFLENRMKRMLKMSLMRVEHGHVRLIEHPRLAEFAEEVYCSNPFVLQQQGTEGEDQQQQNKKQQDIKCETSTCKSSTARSTASWFDIVLHKYVSRSTSIARPQKRRVTLQ